MADVKVNTKLKNRKKSAQKAVRSSARRRIFNMRRTKAMKDLVKEISKLLNDKKAKEAAALFPKVTQAIDKAAKTFVITKNAAARIKSRLAKRVSASQ